MERREFFAAASAGVLGVAAVPLMAKGQEGEESPAPGHHRGHAIGFLGNAGRHANLTQVNFERLVDTLSPAEKMDHGGVINYFNASIGRVQYRVDEAVALLDDPLLPPSELFYVRRLINQPQSSAATSAEGSATWFAQNVIGSFGQMADLATGDNFGLFLGVSNIAQAVWGLLDRGVWHINDAIKEEYYKDPDFFDNP